ncbi:unnamed protein product [Rotaria sordida]|uniref:Uncharacterized protein n=1 Tax=Rotaria sordida TaxID=392033 RepID=A0A820EN59_9BILA|nr:unnamed protein product [Rotaria sordida]
MVEKSSFTPEGKYSYCAQRLIKFLELTRSNSYDNSQYIEFLKFLEKVLQNEKIYFDRTICQTLRGILVNNTTTPAVNRIAKESFDRIFQFIQNFAQVEKYLKDFHVIFRCLLPNCYELLDVPTINRRLKDDIYKFAKIEKDLPEFSELFQECLNKKYDHLSEQEVFSSNGKIKKEIFDFLKQKKNFDDIRKLIQMFNQPRLIDLVEKCEQFVKDKDEKASTEISECLRQCIIDTTENYTTSLLTFRHQALTAFNHFEKNLHDLLSTFL